MVGSVLITGIHTGLGYALAARCLDDGAAVYAVSRTPPEHLVRRPGLEFRPLDLRRFETVAPTIRDLLADVKALDLAILNAGVLGEIKDLKETGIDELRDVMDVNVWANKLVIDALFDLGIPIGQIVAISSGAAFNGSGGWGAYSISKSALNLLVRVYAHEHPDTHFLALAPGVIETPMTRHVVAQPEEPRHPANARIRALFADGRVLSPEQGAANILARLPEMLAKPTGSYVDIRSL
jgi:NAD(P)-dependent dehydrogenase (short-subunit alcohol dehydrogenase family)